jgi:replicative DNA helicase
VNSYQQDDVERHHEDESPTPSLDPTSVVPPLRLIRGSTVFDEIVTDLQAGIADKLFDCGDALPGIEIGPGLLTLIGAPPGRGKTALTMQATYEAVSNEPNLRAVVASLEVSEKTLIKRRLAKLIGASFDAIRFNTLTDYQRECIANLADFRETLELINFVPESMCGLGDLEALLTSGIEPGLLVIDYLQLFGGVGEDAKVRASQTMATARRFCAEGWAVIAVSALSRGQAAGKKGRYSNADLGSFRDSSAIEYSGAAAYMLEEADATAENEPAPIRQMRLRCLKNRNGERRHIDLWFNGPQMFFAPVDAVTDLFPVSDEEFPRPTDDELEQMFP